MGKMTAKVWPRKGEDSFRCILIGNITEMPIGKLNSPKLVMGDVQKNMEKAMSPTNGCDKLRKLRGRKVIWEGKGGSQARAGQGFALRSQSPDGCRVEGQIILFWQRVRLFELKLAFATGQDEIGEANTPSCPQECGCDKQELSKLPNFSQTNGYYEALDELFLPDAFVELYGNSMRPLFDFSWISLKTILSLVLVGACITLGAYLGHK
ncbi:hypothetical protein HGM15179_009218 [Zosterops borbonicus]|uniref:Uncharacterized protein n=1 Tax=Zosterops borbonicus TaxID=364589 RepID=A0A8K1GHL1_9PASS|nr:hypothetical protein HGM15179_009218 [Zosterops borbonicus]